MWIIRSENVCEREFCVYYMEKGEIEKLAQNYHFQ